MILRSIFAFVFLMMTFELTAEVDFEKHEFERYEFERTVAIYHLVDDGGIIYLRPSDYYGAQGFIRIYEALDEYLFELEASVVDTVLDPTGLPLLDEFLFVNGKESKQYFLKNGWLGDGDRWVAVGHEDYKAIRNVVDERKNVPGSKTASDELRDFTAKIQIEAQESGPLTFDEQFERGSKLRPKLDVGKTKVVPLDSENISTGTLHPKNKSTNRVGGVTDVEEATREKVMNPEKPDSVALNNPKNSSNRLPSIDKVPPKEHMPQEVISRSKISWLLLAALCLIVVFSYVRRRS